MGTYCLCGIDEWHCPNQLQEMASLQLIYTRPLSPKDGCRFDGTGCDESAQCQKQRSDDVVEVEVGDPTDSQIAHDGIQIEILRLRRRVVDPQLLDARPSPGKPRREHRQMWDRSAPVFLGSAYDVHCLWPAPTSQPTTENIYLDVFHLSTFLNPISTSQHSPAIDWSPLHTSRHRSSVSYLRFLVRSLKRSNHMSVGKARKSCASRPQGSSACARTTTQFQNTVIKISRH